MEDLVQFVKDLSPCLSKVRLSRAQSFGNFLFENDWGSGTNWSFNADWDIIVCWEGSSSYLGWGCLNRSLRYNYHLFWRGLCFRPFCRLFNVSSRDNSEPIADRHNTNLCSCFRRLWPVYTSISFIWWAADCWTWNEFASISPQTPRLIMFKYLRPE